MHAEDLSLGFIRVNELSSLGCVELNGGKEYLLCFHGKWFFYQIYAFMCSRDSAHTHTHMHMLLLLSHIVLAMYVDNTGRRSRKEELIWHSNPTDIGKFVTFVQLV